MSCRAPESDERAGDADSAERALAVLKTRGLPVLRDISEDLSIAAYDASGKIIINEYLTAVKLLVPTLAAAAAADLEFQDVASELWSVTHDDDAAPRAWALTWRGSLFLAQVDRVAWLALRGVVERLNANCLAAVEASGAYDGKLVVIADGALLMSSPSSSMETALRLTEPSRGGDFHPQTAWVGVVGVVQAA
jgi:hypothetical protein